MKPEATLLKPSLGVLYSPLRLAEHQGRGALLFAFAAQYRAWLHVVYVNEHTRNPTTIARTVLHRAYVELGLNLAEAESFAKAARRRRRAWMTVDGEDHLGVGVDGIDYRAVAVVLDGQVVVAVVPVGQASVEVRFS